MTTTKDGLTREEIEKRLPHHPLKGGILYLVDQLAAEKAETARQHEHIDRLLEEVTQLTLAGIASEDDLADAKAETARLREALPSDYHRNEAQEAVRLAQAMRKNEQDEGKQVYTADAWKRTAKRLADLLELFEDNAARAALQEQKP